MTHLALRNITRKSDPILMKTNRATPKVMSPEYLKEHVPDTIIVMNPVYREEIAKMVGDMGLESNVITV